MRPSSCRSSPSRAPSCACCAGSASCRETRTQGLANSRKFTEETGVPVVLESENWEDLRPKAAVAANVGSGPDIIIGTNDDPHQYPTKLLDVSDVAEYLGKKYGGWYDLFRQYGMTDGRWIALPQGAGQGAVVYRESHVKAAGFTAISEGHSTGSSSCVRH